MSKPKEVKLVLKKNDEGVVELSDDGFPIWVDGDGKEFAYDVSKLVNDKALANFESSGRRHKITELEQEIEELKKTYEDLDPEAARKALDTVKNLKDKDLVDAEGVEKLKAKMREAYESKEKDAQKKYETIINDRDGVIVNKEAQIRQLLIKNAFASSDFLQSKTTLDPEIAHAYFGNYFIIREIDGHPTAVGRYNNEDITSRKNPGELATPEEAIEFLVEKYPNKERFLKGTGQSGSGVFNPDQHASDQPQALTDVLYPSMKTK